MLLDPHCTPGATNRAVTQATLESTICKAGWSESRRPPEAVTEGQKRLSLAAYGYSDGRSLHTYEFDHLIPLELDGASDSPENLWPEPDYPGVSDSSYYLNPKDHVEDELHDWGLWRQDHLGRRPTRHRHELDRLVPHAYRPDHHGAVPQTGQDHLPLPHPDRNGHHAGWDEAPGRLLWSGRRRQSRGTRCCRSRSRYKWPSRSGAESSGWESSRGAVRSWSSSAVE